MERRCYKDIENFIRRNRWEGWISQCMGNPECKYFWKAQEIRLFHSFVLRGEIHLLRRFFTFSLFWFKELTLLILKLILKLLLIMNYWDAMTLDIEVHVYKFQELTLILLDDLLMICHWTRDHRGRIIRMFV